MSIRVLSVTSIVLLFGLACATPTSADGPARKFKRLADETTTSPDRQIRIEQYSRAFGDWKIIHQFWTFGRVGKPASLLNRNEDADLAGYPAGFRFSPDSQWLVRMQKLGAGYQTLLLYRRDGNRFLPATKKPLGDLAWDYFFTLPASEGMHRDPKGPYSLDHMQANLLKGMEENYAWLGEHWPDSRYVVISLSFDIQGQEQATPWIEGWRCVYDVKTGTFSAPKGFADNNAKAIKTRGDGRD